MSFFHNCTFILVLNSFSFIEQLKLAGKRSVHKDSKLDKDGGCIFEKDGIIYNCAFSVCDLGSEMNQYVFLLSYILMFEENEGYIDSKCLQTVSMQLLHSAADHG